MGQQQIVINHCKSLPASHFKFMTSWKKKCWNNNFPICAECDDKMGGIENCLSMEILNFVTYTLLKFTKLSIFVIMCDSKYPASHISLK